MAATVASLLTDSIKKSKLFEGLAASPAVRASMKAAQVAKVVGQDVGKVTGPLTRAGTGGIGGMGGGKDLAGMAGSIGEFLPKLGKLAHPTQLLGLPKKLLSKGMGLMGINLSLSTLLRQSQLFTGILGALFQILGGFVDVILAPFMPFFVNIIRKLAEQIPKIREWAQKLHDWLSIHVFPLIKKGFEWIWSKLEPAITWIQEHMPELKEKIMGFFNTSIKPAFERIWEIIKNVWGWLKEHVWPTIVATWDLFLDMGKTLWEWLSSEAWPVFKNIFANLKTIFEGMLKWLREDIYPLIKDFWSWLVTEIGGFILWLANNIVARLVTIIPLIQSIITQVLDILINSILKPLWTALEPILKWWLNTYMDNWTFIIRMIEGKILPFIQDIIDDLMPHVQDLSDFFMKYVAPRITEYFEALRDFVDAFLDVALPLIRVTLKYVIWPVAKFLLKGIGFILVAVFKVMTWLLRGLTWLLRLPFMWRQSLLDPLLSALDFGFDWIKKIWNFFQTIDDRIRIILLSTLAKFLQKISGGGSLTLGSVFGKDIKLPMNWLMGIGNQVMGVANDAFYSLERKNEALRQGLSSSTGGMRQAYGTTGLEVTINNYSERHVLDDTRRLQLMSGEKREIDNIREKEDSLGSYDDIPAGLK